VFLRWSSLLASHGVLGLSERLGACPGGVSTRFERHCLLLRGHPFDVGLQLVTGNCCGGSARVAVDGGCALGLLVGDGGLALLLLAVEPRGTGLRLRLGRELLLLGDHGCLASRELGFPFRLVGPFTGACGFLRCRGTFLVQLTFRRELLVTEDLPGGLLQAAGDAVGGRTWRTRLRVRHLFLLGTTWFGSPPT